MEKETMNLKYTLENIKADKKAYENFQKAQTVEEVYKICKEYGYEGTYEKLVKEVTDLMSMNLQNVSMSDLEKVAGGKLEAKKGIAGALSALSLMNGMVPLSGAAEVKQKTVNESGSVLNKVDKQTVGVALGAFTAGALIRELFSKFSSAPANKEILTEESFFTEDGKDVFRKINAFRNYLKSNKNLIEKFPLAQLNGKDTHQFMLFWYSNGLYMKDQEMTNLFMNVISSVSKFVKAQFNRNLICEDIHACTMCADSSMCYSFFGNFNRLAGWINDIIYEQFDLQTINRKKRYDAITLSDYLYQMTYIDFYK